MHKKFLLFAGNDYYPKGGAEDFKGRYETIVDAINAHNPNEYLYEGGWADIFDLQNESIVASFRRGTWYNDNNEIINEKH